MEIRLHTFFILFNYNRYKLKYEKGAKMKYKYILPTFCLFSTMSLYAEQQNDLGNILQQAGQKNVLVKPVPKKKRSKKESRFTFVDRNNVNFIESKSKKEAKDRSESYEYENKERFEFKFNPGTGYNNIAAGPTGSSTGGGGSAGAAGGGMSGGGMSGGGNGGGGHR